MNSLNPLQLMTQWLTITFELHWQIILGHLAIHKLCHGIQTKFLFTPMLEPTLEI